MLVRGVHHLAIQVRDLAACERFYVDVLGLSVQRRWPDEGGGERSVWLDLAPGFLALERARGEAEPRPFEDERPGLHLFALGIEAAKRSAWRARLRAAGVDIVHESDFTLYVQDPEGNRVALSHWPTPRPAEDAFGEAR